MRKTKNQLLTVPQTQKLSKCSKCQKLVAISKFSKDPRKPNGLGAWCKECVCKNARLWYKKHKTQAKETSLKWARENPEKRKASCDKYFKKNKEIILEKNRAYKGRLKLDVWIQETDHRVIKSNEAGPCDSCGMPTRKVDLYKFDARTLCWECLRDTLETGFHPRKRFVIPKRICNQCGREHIGTGPTCIDCVVNSRQKKYQKIYLSLMKTQDRKSVV